MKTTNILLGIIAFLLLLNLTKNSSYSFFPEVNAQVNKTQPKLTDEVINVRIVSVVDNAVMNIALQRDIIGNYQALPVLVVNALDKYKLNVPVFLVNK